MALTIYKNKEAGGRMVKLDRRLWKTAAGDLVEDGHPEAAYLYGSAGKEVQRADFEARGGVVEDEPKVDAPKTEPKPKPKAQPKPKRKTTKKGK